MQILLTCQSALDHCDLFSTADCLAMNQKDDILFPVIFSSAERFLPRDAMLGTCCNYVFVCLSQAGTVTKRLNVGSHKRCLR